MLSFCERGGLRQCCHSPEEWSLIAIAAVAPCVWLSLLSIHVFYCDTLDISIDGSLIFRLVQF